MDPTQVTAIRKELEAKSTAELRHAFNSGDQKTMDVIRQLLDDRERNSKRLTMALSSAVLAGAIGAAYGWWNDWPAELVLLIALGLAILSVASFYIRNLFGQP